MIQFSLTLSEQQAWALAECLKRMSYSDYRAHAVDEAEAQQMRDATEALRRALVDAGINPR